MNYVYVYASTDDQKIALLKTHFEREGITYKVGKVDSSGRSAGETAIEVAEEDREKAREILHQVGMLRITNRHMEENSNSSMKKGVLILFAALVLFLVFLAIWWFMNAAQ